MKVWMLAFVAAMITVPGVAVADHHGDKARLERAGSCSDAKQQMEYFCKEGSAEDDSMISFGTACNNAKNNVKMACEGVDIPDAEYTFDN